MVLSGLDSLFSIKFSRDIDWEMHNYHFHNDCEVLFVVSGSSECLVGTELLHLRRGTILLLYSTVLHKTHQTDGSEYVRYALHFSPDDIAPFSTSETDLLSCFKNKKCFIQLEDKAACDMIEIFDKCGNSKSGFGSDIRRRNAFFELLVKLGEMSKTGHGAELVNSKSFSRIQPVLLYINENLTDPLQLDFITEKFHFSKQYFCRVFKKTTGVTLGEYITSVRVRNACALLRLGYSVQSSGEESGFRNNASFITTFGKIIGMTPGKYKRHFSGTVQINTE